ncbi:Mariner Mos1 transposase like protein [Argiope bruennichi]|uniref:Mariner Mos1 transposase like protein n=1 Tax=Argiope bruennichi TaxID=94029 RepID=A0A8T0EJ61_ARGBR|nr:Mariner Mos1 transposase like protein [Argiope bruennichi]
MVKKKVLFHKDNALVHKVVTVIAKLHELKFKIVPYAPYSPDMVPSDYNLFPNPQKFLAGRKFCSDIKVISTTDACFEDLKEGSYREGFQALSHHWTDVQMSRRFAYNTRNAEVKRTEKEKFSRLRNFDKTPSRRVTQ